MLANSIFFKKNSEEQEVFLVWPNFKLQAGIYAVTSLGRGFP